MTPQRGVSLIYLLLISILSSFATKPGNNSGEESHEITFYAIPPAGNIDWANPSSLFKSTINCYLKAGLRKHYYVIGHVITQISSPLLDSTVYLSMSGAIQTEKLEYVLKKKVGLAALGATLKGHMEQQESIRKGLELYGKRDKVRYIKYKVNEEAIKRIMYFVKYYTERNEYGWSPCEHYNGALYPRYQHEGSGCSAFGVSLLEIAGLLPDSIKKKWMVEINIPMELIGGTLNGNKRIKHRSVLKTKAWHDGSGKENIDFVKFSIYEPAYIFNWIKNKQTNNDTLYRNESNGKHSGITADMRHVRIDSSEDIIFRRTDPNLFVKHYIQSYHKNLKDSTINLTAIPEISRNIEYKKSSGL